MSENAEMQIEETVIDDSIIQENVTEAQEEEAQKEAAKAAGETVAEDNEIINETTDEIIVVEEEVQKITLQHLEIQKQNKKNI
ncbi:MAG: hypothetical protein HRT47_13450 [Candidatus Caenarcaniphilales bacterium]|nr:hypothetical protein [Candidatus Caenarcaniphilales bacterium]